MPGSPGCLLWYPLLYKREGPLLDTTRVVDMILMVVLILLSSLVSSVAFSSWISWTLFHAF